VGYGLYSGLRAVQWATVSAVGYGLYSGLRLLQWTMGCTVGYGFCSGIWALHWATGCTVGYGLYNLEIAIRLPTGRRFYLEYCTMVSTGNGEHFEGACPNCI